MGVHSDSDVAVKNVGTDLQDEIVCDRIYGFIRETLCFCKSSFHVKFEQDLLVFIAFVEEICTELGVLPWPHGTTGELRDLVSSQGVVEVFIAYCHQIGLRSKTIDVYISALKYW